jgi:hypothetical protein
MTHSSTPDLVPVLSRGKHRNPRKGACFMELASFLAGEPWSDHPACTHPLLSALARDINDHVGDEARRDIAPLIPEVIGLNRKDPRIDVWLAREVAMTALPVVSAERQGVAAVGLLRCERVLNEIERRPKDYISPRTQAALEAVPHARDWARSFSGMGWGKQESFTRRSAPAIIHSAVSGIACACVEDPERILVKLLKDSIADCRAWMRLETAQVTGDQWHEVCELTTR